LGLAFALVSCVLAQQTKEPGHEAHSGTARIASIWDGVFTAAQAKRGKAIYPAPCGTCHGRRLNGAPEDPDVPSTPPIGRAKFLRSWEGRTLATLLEYTRATMPENNPGYLSDQEYIDVIAYMLSMSGVPAGEHELRRDPQRLRDIVIEQRP
jgi:mono/diheme cytochrome c family protein